MDVVQVNWFLGYWCWSERQNKLSNLFTTSCFCQDYQFLTAAYVFSWYYFFTSACLSEKGLLFSKDLGIKLARCFFKRQGTSWFWHQIEFSKIPVFEMTFLHFFHNTKQMLSPVCIFNITGFWQVLKCFQRCANQKTEYPKKHAVLLSAKVRFFWFSHQRPL